MLLRICLLLSIVVSIAASAADFDVQIGAFRNPDAASLKVPAEIGSVRTSRSDDGLTRVLVGPFASRTEAAAARDRLRSMGYPGAFLRSAGLSARAAVTPTVVESAHRSAPADTSGPSQRDLDLLMSLSDEERRDVVYLDGRLHRKVGDQFIPLRD